MNQNRFRQIARLENAARPYIGMRNQIRDQWQMTRVGAAKHAAILAFLIRYGDPRIGEPLSCAWQRFTDTDVWREYCRKWDEMKIGHLRKLHGESSTQYHQSFIPRNHKTISPFSRDGVSIIGMELRHELLERFSGSNEKEKLDTVFASAPPWFIWFTFGDYSQSCWDFICQTFRPSCTSRDRKKILRIGMGYRWEHLKADPGLMDLTTNSFLARIWTCCVQQEKTQTIK